MAHAMHGLFTAAAADLEAPCFHACATVVAHAVCRLSPWESLASTMIGALRSLRVRPHVLDFNRPAQLACRISLTPPVQAAVLREGRAAARLRAPVRADSALRAAGVPAQQGRRAGHAGGAAAACGRPCRRRRSALIRWQRRGGGGAAGGPQHVYRYAAAVPSNSIVMGQCSWLLMPVGESLQRHSCCLPRAEEYALLARAACGVRAH